MYNFISKIILIGPGGLPVPTGVRIAGCDSSPCHINQGDSITYEVDFPASELIYFIIIALGSNSIHYIVSSFNRFFDTIVVCKCFGSGT